MVEADALVLPHLCAIREQLDTLNDRMLELTQRLGNLEVQAGSLFGASKTKKTKTCHG
jgi:hypothetical protein